MDSNRHQETFYRCVLQVNQNAIISKPYKKTYKNQTDPETAYKKQQHNLQQIPDTVTDITPFEDT